MLLIYYLKVIHSGDDCKSSPGAVQLADGVSYLNFSITNLFIISSCENVCEMML